ncbi:MAG: D-glycerate dehydrogenase [Brevefilum sp.]|nr:D-glycerate dehydrogenase [Brevefilum sp.]MDT8381614.1 D-glycerate dehydrogenase [Brevefilum sp.]MDW7753848.1 D-glycerate dehydrogenase [Brevefilum sp.]
MPFKVFVTRHLTPDAEEKLTAFCNAEYWPEKTPPPYQVLLEKTQDVDGLITMLTDPIDKNVIEGAKNLKVISQAAVGVDNIDLKAAAARNIPVGHTPDLLTDATADLAFALILGAARRMREAIDYARGGHWQTWSLTNLLGADVHGRTLGIIGMGRIGQAVARRAVGFEMQILYYNRSRVSKIETELGASYVPLNELLQSSDIISLHVPLNKESKGLIGAEQLKLMKEDAILVNTARGEVIDTDALMSALKSNQIGYAALDVTDPEPLPNTHELYQLPNIIITPHIGSATRTTRSAMAMLAVDNLIAGLENRPLPKAVVPSNS